MKVPSPNLSVGNGLFVLAIALFAVSFTSGGLDPDPIPRPAGQISSYPGVAGDVGFIMHFFGGCVYVGSGILQFIPILRRNFPLVHRFFGYLFYVAQLITMVGNMVWLYGRTEYLKGGLTTLFAVTVFYNPAWLYFMFRSLNAVFKGDIHTHHMFMIRAVALSVGNFAVPLLDVVIRIIVPSYQHREAYSTAFWFGFLLTYVIGELYIHFFYKKRATVPVIYLPNDAAGPKITLCEDLRAWTPLTLISKEADVKEEYYKMVFEAPHIVYVPPSHHVTLKIPGEQLGKRPTFRPYSPINVEGRRIEFYLKKYTPGPMSTFLASMKINDQVLAAGPFGVYELRNHSKMLMLAAGTGITPMLSIVKSGLEKLKFETHYHLIWFTPSSALVEDELRQLKAAYPDQFDFEIISKRDSPTEIASHLSKFASKDKSEIFTGSNAQVLICGPRGFTRDMIEKAWKSGISEGATFSFGHTDH